MKITEEIMKQTYEKTIDNHIEDIKRMQSEGLVDETDLMLLDTCLKYTIFMSELRNSEKEE